MPRHFRYLYFVGPRDKLPKPLENSLVRELPNLVVRLSSDWENLVSSARIEDVFPSLVLVDEAYAAANASDLPMFRDQYPESPLCLTLNGESKSKQHIRVCLENGVFSNVLPMNLRLDLWLFAIETLLHGGTYMPPDLTELLEIDRNLQLEKEQKLARDSNGNDGPAVGSLTPREREVLALIAQGQQNKNIAANLSLSEHTIKLHIHHIISKMGVSNRTEAAAAFYQMHGIDGGTG